MDATELSAGKLRDLLKQFPPLRRAYVLDDQQSPEGALVIKAAGEALTLFEVALALGSRARNVWRALAPNSGAWEERRSGERCGYTEIMVIHPDIFARMPVHDTLHSPFGIPVLRARDE